MQISSRYTFQYNWVLKTHTRHVNVLKLKWTTYAILIILVG